MPNNLTDTAENLLLDLLNGVTTAAPVTTPLKVALVTTLGSDSLPGTEVSGGSYARQNVTFGASTGGSAASTNAIVFSALPATTVVGVEIYDSSATPKRLWWAPLAVNRATQAGDSLTFAIGGLTAQLD